MKNKVLLYTNLVLSVICIFVSNRYINESFIHSLNVGYLAGTVVAYLTPTLRTNAQVTKVKTSEKTIKIVLIALAIIIPAINIVYFLQ